MAIDIREAVEGLKRYGDFTEAYEVHSFETYRRTGDGQSQTVVVKILDGGPDAGDSRYAVEASTEDGKKVTRGGHAESVDVALGITRFYELD